MPVVHCSRCGNNAEGLAGSPFPGPIGEQVLERTCASCWSDWMAVQVKVINENRLSPADPQHFEQLTDQLKAFLNLTED